MPDNLVVTVTASGRSIVATGGGLGNNTIGIGPKTTIVTITQGANVTLLGNLSLPSTFSAPIAITPTSVTIANKEYVFTCTNNLTAKATPITTSFLLTASVSSATTTFVHDPTMIFNPPQQD